MWMIQLFHACYLGLHCLSLYGVVHLGLRVDLNSHFLVGPLVLPKLHSGVSAMPDQPLQLVVFDLV